MKVHVLKEIQQLLFSVPALSSFEERLVKLLNDLETVASNNDFANDKMVYLDDSAIAFLQDLHTSMKQLLQSETYEQDIRLMKETYSQLKEQNSQLHDMRYTIEQANSASSSVVILEQWLEQQGQQFQNTLPLDKWKQSISKHHILLAEIYQFNKQAEAYMIERKKISKNIMKRLLLKKKHLHYLNNEGQKLNIQRNELLNNIRLFDEEIQNIQLTWKLNQHVLQGATTETTYYEQANIQIKQNKHALNDLSHLMRKWRALVDIHTLIQATTMSNLESLSFPHVQTYSEVEQMIIHYNNALLVPVFSTKALDSQEQSIVLPKIQVEPIAINTKNLHSYVGVIVIPSAIAIFFITYTFISTVLSDQLDTMTSSLVEHETISEVEPAQRAVQEAPVEREIVATSAKILPDHIRQTVGYVVPTHNNVPIYSHPDADEAPIGYLTAGESYDILAVSERLRMKLSDNEWLIYDETDMYFEQEELAARLQPIYAPLHEARVTTKIVPIFSEPSRNSDIIGYLEDASTVTIYNTAFGDWIDIGNEAWVEENKYLSISWPYEHVNSLPNPIGEVMVVTSDFLNVRSKPSLSAQIVGRLNEYERVYVYEHDRNTGWLKIGPDGWVSGDSRYVSYTAY